MSSAAAVIVAERNGGGGAVSPPATPAADQTPAQGADYACACDGPSSETTPARPEPRRGLFRHRYARWTEEDTAELRERLKTQTVKQVAYDFGMPASTLRMSMHRAGIKAREYSAEGLPPRAALLIHLFDQGLSRAEMAARMGITERSVTAWLSRLRKRLRETQR